MDASVSKNPCYSKTISLIAYREKNSLWPTMAKNSLTSNQYTKNKEPSDQALVFSFPDKNKFFPFCTFESGLGHCQWSLRQMRAMERGQAAILEPGPPRLSFNQVYIEVESIRTSV